MEDYELIFNNKNCYKDLNLAVAEYPVIPQLNEDVEEIPIENRNGSLIIKKGTYKNRSFDITFSLLKFDNYYRRIDLINEWLDNVVDNKLIYGRYDRCYKIKNITKGDLKRELEQEGTFTITVLTEPFLCDLEETELEITENNFELQYFGTAEEHPIIIIYGSGNIQFGINDSLLEIKDVKNNIEIDSDLLKVKDNNGENKDSNGNYPILVSGINKVNWVGSVEKIIIKFLNRYK